jgi:hypothetical protein
MPDNSDAGRCECREMPKPLMLVFSNSDIGRCHRNQPMSVIWLVRHVWPISQLLAEGLFISSGQVQRSARHRLGLCRSNRHLVWGQRESSSLLCFNEIVRCLNVCWCISLHFLCCIVCVTVSISSPSSSPLGHGSPFRHTWLYLEVVINWIIWRDVSSTGRGSSGSRAESYAIPRTLDFWLPHQPQSQKVHALRAMSPHREGQSELCLREGQRDTCANGSLILSILEESVGGLDYCLSLQLAPFTCHSSRSEHWQPLIV